MLTVPCQIRHGLLIPANPKPPLGMNNVPSDSRITALLTEKAAELDDQPLFPGLMNARGSPWYSCFVPLLLRVDSRLFSSASHSSGEGLHTYLLGITNLFVKWMQKNLYIANHPCVAVLFGSAVAALSLESMLSYAPRTILSSKNNSSVHSKVILVFPGISLLRMVLIIHCNFMNMYK